WEVMVNTYFRVRSNLKSVVVILDIRREPNQGDLDLLKWLKYYGINTTLVLTKVDKISRRLAIKQADLIERQLGEISYTGPALFSAKTRQGREEIWVLIKRLLVDQGGAGP
ncbi:MAG: YihA family ribosome biogenesis GTP-binding protein, partial [Thermodesulfobacteriota bacterium]|nr:YihA family ribosome biogenesis GTP-binding protein [Thermodesulfobacteriota bacterium]